MRHVDLNSDMGEGFGAYKMGDDAAMLDIVTSANIACGFHAGDPDIMVQTASKAREKGVNIGAHPGFADLFGFGRRVIKGDSYASIERHIAYQIGAMQACATLSGHRITYVKAHGALSNMAQEDFELANALSRAIYAVDKTLINMVMPGLAVEKAAIALNQPHVLEVFADRTYEESGNLTSRKIAGSVIHDAEIAAARLLDMLETGSLMTTTGKRLKVKIDTICVHSDEPSAVALARRVREILEGNGWQIKAFV
jgi:5-oxoprolinase (ATP-hydrolysing) subunit A